MSTARVTYNFCPVLYIYITISFNFTRNGDWNIIQEYAVDEKLLNVYGIILTHVNGDDVAMCTGQCIGCITICHHKQLVGDIQ